VTRVAVVGAAGYAGVEAVRWVLGHPHLELAAVTSAADAGKPLAATYPALAVHTEARFVAPDADAICAAADVAILSVPHTAALALAPTLIERGLTVIDLSADFRLTDAAVYETWYGTAHTAPALLGDAVYGCPELDRTRLPGAQLVACPGCYPTATILAAMPALEAGVWTGGTVVVDAKSGVSGAGRSPSAASHFVAANEATSAYKVGTHRHTPEMEQALTTAAGTPVGVLFTPHLVPMSRGLLSTVYLSVDAGLSLSDAIDLYHARYADEPFVRVCATGECASTAEVRGTNNAVVSVHVDERSSMLVASCAIDNLGKGAAGQGIQCLNAVLGLPETTGLLSPGPVV